MMCCSFEARDGVGIYHYLLTWCCDGGPSYSIGITAAMQRQTGFSKVFHDRFRPNLLLYSTTVSSTVNVIVVPHTYIVMTYLFAVVSPDGAPMN